MHEHTKAQPHKSVLRSSVVKYLSTLHKITGERRPSWRGGEVSKCPSKFIGKLQCDFHFTLLKSNNV